MGYTKILTCLSLAVVVVLASSCNDNTKTTSTSKEKVSENYTLASRFEHLLEHPVSSEGFPRSYEKREVKVRTVPSKDWTSGFFPGNLWNLFRLTGDSLYLERAKDWTVLMEQEKDNDRTHDMGFKIMCSFGQGYQITGEKHYKEVILESAKTLSTRFNETVGCIRSWDFNRDVWEFPVIIDNMMNLELLFEATRMSGDSSFHKMAVSHADTTLKNHYRDDESTYHVVVYDTLSGKVKDRVTHQGIADSSSWARGQTWGIYGFIMSHRYTKKQEYLDQAIASVSYFLNHPNLPEDKIPYWDFDDPSIPDAPRDVSAAAILASALLELNAFTKNTTYKEVALEIVDRLKSEKYLLGGSSDIPFLLDYSTGNKPRNDEIDVPIVYADYYLLEALVRLQKPTI